MASHLCHPPHLTDLVINNCNITSFPSTAFTELVFMRLVSNGIEELPETFSKNLPKIVSMYVSRQPLTA